jgi:hypothetical protein
VPRHLRICPTHKKPVRKRIAPALPALTLLKGQRLAVKTQTLACFSLRRTESFSRLRLSPLSSTAPEVSSLRTDAFPSLPRRLSKLALWGPYRSKGNKTLS